MNYTVKITSKTVTSACDACVTILNLRVGITNAHKFWRNHKENWCKIPMTCEGKFFKLILCWSEKDYQTYNLIVPSPFLLEVLST